MAKGGALSRAIPRVRSPIMVLGKKVLVQLGQLSHIIKYQRSSTDRDIMISAIKDELSRLQGVGSPDSQGPPAPRIERLSPVMNYCL